MDIKDWKISMELKSDGEMLRFLEFLFNRNIQSSIN